MDNDSKSKVASDYHLIQSLAIPEDSKVPDALHGISTATEYDLYFRLMRTSPDLKEWSKTCLCLYENQAKDLDETSLDDKEKYQIVRGWLVIFQVTLEKWLKIYEVSGKDEQN